MTINKLLDMTYHMINLLPERNVEFSFRQALPKLSAFALINERNEFFVCSVKHQKNGEKKPPLS